MRRSVDRLTRDRRPWPGRKTAACLTLVGFVSIQAVAGDGDLPDLSPPNEMKIISKPMEPAPTPSPKPVKPAAPGRAVLAIPGLTTPSSRANSLLPAPKPPADPNPDDLSLEAPIEMRPTLSPLPDRSSSNPSSRSSLPLILESSTDDDPGARPSTLPTSRKPATTQSAPSPARRSRLFGFLGGPVAPSPIEPSTSPKVNTPGRALAGDDPAPESALKRRIERQAREVVGNRARSVEVKLNGKEAVVRVSEVKLFQKRTLRKQLEGIPALSGLRSTIEILD